MKLAANATSARPSTSSVSRLIRRFMALPLEALRSCPLVLHPLERVRVHYDLAVAFRHLVAVASVRPLTVVNENTTSILRFASSSLRQRHHQHGVFEVVEAHLQHCGLG